MAFWLPYSGPTLLLAVVQATLAALPAAGLPKFAKPFAGKAWSLVLPLSISLVIGALIVVPKLAIGLTWLSLFAMPLLAMACLGWAMHGARHWCALVVVPFVAIAIAWQKSWYGELSALLISALSCVTLARLLAGIVDGNASTAADAAEDPPAFAEDPQRRILGGTARGGTTRQAWFYVRVALVITAVIDSILVFTTVLDAPNDDLNHAHPVVPGLGPNGTTFELPRLQFLYFRGAYIGYEDTFTAAVLGAVLVAEGASLKRQASAALTILVLGLLFDLLFFVVKVLPDTVPVAACTLLFWPGGLQRICRGSRAEPSDAAGCQVATVVL